MLVQLIGLINSAFQNEQLNLVLLNLRFLRMVVVKRFIFGNGAIEVADQKVVVAKQDVGIRVVRQFTLDLLHVFFCF